MRYSRGYIALSDASDVPVLLHIRNARAICFDQLRDLILFDCAGVAVNSLRWRVARMEKAGVIQRFQEVRHFGKPVYGITPAGVAFLESRGHMLFSLPSTTEKKIIHSLQIPHALELVNIRLALLRADILLAWKCELEIASRNLVLDGPPAKDYDAIAEIEVDDQSVVTTQVPIHPAQVSRIQPTIHPTRRRQVPSERITMPESLPIASPSAVSEPALIPRNTARVAISIPPQ